MAARAERDKRKAGAIEKRLAATGDPRDAMRGGAFFLKLGDLDRAYPWLLKMEVLDAKRRSQIAALYTTRGQYDRSKQIIAKGLEHCPDSYDLNLALGRVYFEEGEYQQVEALLQRRVCAITEEADEETAAEAAYIYGMSLLEMGRLAEGVEYVARASETLPSAVRYKMAGIYALARADQWEALLQAAGLVVEQEKIPIDFEIRNLNDVGRLFMEMAAHFSSAGKREEIQICHNVLAHAFSADSSNQSVNL